MECFVNKKFDYEKIHSKLFKISFLILLCSRYNYKKVYMRLFK